MLLRQARLIDVSSGQAGEPVDLCIRDHRIARGENGDAMSLDLAGRFVLPGLWDSHVHMAQWAMSTRRLDLSGATSAAAAAASVREAAAWMPANQPLFGREYRDGAWPDRPTLGLLDAAVHDRPVVLISHDLHAVWLNSAAAEHFGVQADDGRLTENGAFELQRRIVDQSDATVDAWIADAARAASALGVTGIVDFAMADNPTDWRRRFGAGTRILRVKAGFYAEQLDDTIAEGLHTGDQLDADGWLHLGPLKIIADGALGSRTAWCAQPYTGSQDAGAPNLPPGELTWLVRRCAQHDLSAAVHAIGDRALEAALAAFAETGARGSIEHVQLVTPEAVRTMARLPLTASVQPAHLLDDRDAADRLWASRAGDAFAYRTLRDGGVPLTLGSDAPVAELNPWLAIQSAVLRARGVLSGSGYRADRDRWHPEQALSLSEGLQASTGGVMKLVPGAPADLIALDENPFDVEIERLHTFGAAVSMVAGEVVHSHIGQPH